MDLFVDSVGIFILSQICLIPYDININYFNNNFADEMSADTGYWQSTTAATKASSLSDKNYYYLPYWDHKQCMHVRSIWPDHRRRMYNSNLIANVIEKFVSIFFVLNARQI